MQRIEEDPEKGIDRYLKALHEIQNRDETLSDAVEFKSEGERHFEVLGTDFDVVSSLAKARF